MEFLQIKPTRLFREFGGCEINRELSHRKFKSRRLDRGTHAIPRFANLYVRQAHQIERRKAVGEMHFDGHQFGVHAGKRATVGNGKRHGLSAVSKILLLQYIKEIEILLFFSCLI